MKKILPYWFKTVLRKTGVWLCSFLYFFDDSADEKTILISSLRETVEKQRQEIYDLKSQLVHNDPIMVMMRMSWFKHKEKQNVR